MKAQIGWVAERSKAAASKAAGRVKPFRGFESHPIRHALSSRLGSREAYWVIV